VRALRATGIQLAQTSTAAGIAWLLAHDVLGHSNAFFAPIAAVIALGLAPGKRTRRAVEMVLGVAVGIAVGDLLISAIGTGAVQVGLVVLLAMAAAVLLGGRPLLVSQAATSAVIVATVRTSGGLVPSRFVDVLVGGGVGIAVLIVAPRDPLRLARRAGAPTFAAVAGVLDDIAAALATGDLEATTRALDRARSLDGLVARLHEALVAAQETTLLAPFHWGERGHIERYATAATQLELAVRNIRVLARACTRAVELEPQIPETIHKAVSQLAAAVRELELELEHGGHEAEARARALGAARCATLTLGKETGFATDVLIGQVRSIATDLLRALGYDQTTAISDVRASGEGHEADTSHPSPADRL